MREGAPKLLHFYIRGSTALYIGRVRLIRKWGRWGKFIFVGITPLLIIMQLRLSSFQQSPKYEALIQQYSICLALYDRSKQLSNNRSKDQMFWWHTIILWCVSLPHLIFVTFLTYIDGEKLVLWRNFKFQCVTDVEKSEISPHTEKFQIFHTTKSEILPNLDEF